MLAFLRTSFDVMKAIPKVLQMHFSKIVAIKNFFSKCHRSAFQPHLNEAAKVIAQIKMLNCDENVFFSFLANLSRVIPTSWGKLEA